MRRLPRVSYLVYFVRIISYLGVNITLFEQEGTGHLSGLYEQHARGNDSFSILCQSSLNTGAVLKDEACTWLDLIYRRLSAHRRIKRLWFLDFSWAFQRRKVTGRYKGNAKQRSSFWGIQNELQLIVSKAKRGWHSEGLTSWTLFNMARRKAKVYSRFNVGVFMKEKRLLRDEAAKAHKVLVKQKAKLSKLIRKVSIHTHHPPPLWLCDYCQHHSWKKKIKNRKLDCSGKDTGKNCEIHYLL